MTECSTPPSEEVEWIVAWPSTWNGQPSKSSTYRIARTAWLAHQQVKGAPAFGSCRVVRVKGANE